MKRISSDFIALILGVVISAMPFTACANPASTPAASTTNKTLTAPDAGAAANYTVTPKAEKADAPNPGVATVDTITVESDYLATPMKVSVVVPSNAKGERLPVVYLLNGYGGGYKDWVNMVPRVKQLSEQLGIILVCPDGRDSWYFDSKRNPKMQMESFITKVLVPEIDKLYPTIPDAKHRAIAGLSMGGHGAMWLGLRHPDLFGSMAAISGGVNIEKFPGKWKIADALGPYASNQKAWHDGSIINIVPLQPTGQNIMIDCGISDFFSDVNADLHKKLVANKIPHDYVSRPGNHSWKYWGNSIVYVLQYFNEAFK